MAVQTVQPGAIRRLIVALQTPTESMNPVANPYAAWLAAPEPETVPRHYTWRFTHLCVVCGQEFQSAKSTTKCCGSGCRVKLCRSRKHVQQNHEKILWSIGALQDMCEAPDPVMVLRARKALAALKAEVAEACAESKV